MKFTLHISTDSKRKDIKERCCEVLAEFLKKEGYFSVEFNPKEIDTDKLGKVMETNEVTKSGIELIAEERQRQIDVEGWTKEHDAEHTNDSLALAAVCYAIPSELRRYYYCPLRKDRVPYFWPWDKEWWKPCPEDRIRELTKAGALIAAEIDRLQME